MGLDLFLFFILMDMETLVLVLIILGIMALIGVSMLIPSRSEHSCLFTKSGENGSKSFSWGFFIGMLFPILVFLLLGGFGYAVCSKGYCTLGNMLPLLSGLGVLWITFIVVKFVTPIFIGRVAVEHGGTYNLSDRRALRMKNLTNYILYALLLSLILFSLLFVDVDGIAESIRTFISDFGWKRAFVEGEYFRNLVAWFFYMVNIAALMGVISTLKMVAGDAERRGQERFQEQKLRDFEKRTKKF